MPSRATSPPRTRKRFDDGPLFPRAFVDPDGGAISFPAGVRIESELTLAASDVTPTTFSIVRIDGAGSDDGANHFVAATLPLSSGATCEFVSGFDGPSQSYMDFASFTSGARIAPPARPQSVGALCAGGVVGAEREATPAPWAGPRSPMKSQPSDTRISGSVAANWFGLNPR